jgi:hypothetical protein
MNYVLSSDCSLLFCDTVQSCNADSNASMEYAASIFRTKMCNLRKLLSYIGRLRVKRSLRLSGEG